MDEESFQRLCEIYGDIHLSSPPVTTADLLEFREQLVAKGMRTGVVDSYVKRYQIDYGNNWRSGFSDQTFQAEISAVHLGTENIYLKSLRDRFYFNNEDSTEIDIGLSDTSPHRFTIDWFPYSSPSFEYDTKKYVIFTPQSQGGESHILPHSTLMTVSTSTAVYLVFPLAYLVYGKKDTGFFVVWIPGLSEFGLLMDYNHQVYDEEPPFKFRGLIATADRSTLLPGVGVRVSLAILSKLNLDNNKRGLLKVIEDKGFVVYPAGRFSGVVRPLDKDLMVDPRG